MAAGYWVSGFNPQFHTSSLPLLLFFRRREMFTLYLGRGQ